MKKKCGIIIIAVSLLICVSLVAVLKLNTSEKVKAETNNNDVYEVKSYITEDILANSQDCKTDLYLLEEFTPDKIGNDADVIALATVLTLDGADPNGSLVGMTNGTMLVNNVLKGENSVNGQVISYSKPGGMMKMSEWEKTQPEAANLKRQYLREKNNVDVDLDKTYVNLAILGDIEIEAGKSYLVYLKKNLDKYEIIGLGNGLRELNVTQAISKVSLQSFDINTLKIKNNETGEFESLKDYMDMYINNK